MSEFNVGDKVYLECEVKRKDMGDNTYGLKYKNWYGNECPTGFVKDDVLHTPDELYNKGLNDAWELAKKIVQSSSIGGYTANELVEIFGSVNKPVLDAYTPQEALAKVKGYEERNEIKVGDIVNDELCSTAIVTRVEASKRTLYVLYSDGSCGCCNIANYTKTGKHYDSIDEFMKS